MSLGRPCEPQSQEGFYAFDVAGPPGRLLAPPRAITRRVPEPVTGFARCEGGSEPERA